MMYLIIQETKFNNIDNMFNVINFTNDLEKANDMLQGYNLINKDNTVVYSIVKYEQPERQKVRHNDQNKTKSRVQK